MKGLEFLRKILPFAALCLLLVILIYNTIQRYELKKRGIREVYGICESNERVLKRGRIIRYHYKLDDVVYQGSSGAKNKSIWRSVKPGDSIIIKVSVIDPKFSFIDD